MLLENKNAVVYGAGGAVGGAIARAFAREGARVFLTGRRLPAVNAVAEDISGAGGIVEADQVDALDEQGVEKHIGAVVKKAGKIDISFNAIGIPGRRSLARVCRVSLSPNSRWRRFLSPSPLIRGLTS